MLCVHALHGVVCMPYFVDFEVTSIIIMWNDFQLNITCALYDADTSTYRICRVFIYSWGIYVISVISLKQILKYFLHTHDNEICKQNGTNENRTIGHGLFSMVRVKIYLTTKEMGVVECTCRYRANNSFHAFSPPSRASTSPYERCQRKPHDKTFPLLIKSMKSALITLYTTQLHPSSIRYGPRIEPFSAYE